MLELGEQRDKDVKSGKIYDLFLFSKSWKESIKTSELLRNLSELWIYYIYFHWVHTLPEVKTFWEMKE